MTLPDLRTDRLDLRPFTQSDIDPLHRLWTDPVLRVYLWDGEIISRLRAVGVVEASIASAQSTGIGIWAVRLIGTAEIVGFCGFRPVDEPRVAELVYGIAPAHQRRGFGSESSAAAIRFAFDILDLRRIVAGARKVNTASFRVMEKLGFRFEEQRLSLERDEEWWTLTASTAIP